MFIFTFIIEKITSFVLSLYDKSRFIFTIYFYIICLVLYSWNLGIVGKKFFFPIHDQKSTFMWYFEEDFYDAGG